MYKRTCVVSVALSNMPCSCLTQVFKSNYFLTSKQQDVQMHAQNAAHTCNEQDKQGMWAREGMTDHRCNKHVDSAKPLQDIGIYICGLCTRRGTIRLQDSSSPV